MDQPSLAMWCRVTIRLCRLGTEPDQHRPQHRALGQVEGAPGLGGPSCSSAASRSGPPSPARSISGSGGTNAGSTTGRGRPATAR